MAQKETEDSLTKVEKSRAEKRQIAATSSTSGGTPPGGWEPEDHEEYKKELRKDMQRPHAEDKMLAEALQNLHRADKGVGSGSTASAVRYEKATGQLVQGKSHIQKAEDGVKFLERWLNKNPSARPGDKAAAENVLKDLKDALGKK